MAGTEALVAQGFPVHPVIHEGAGGKFCCFNVPVSEGEYKREARYLRQQAGNSMHLFVMTVQILFVLTHSKVA